MVALADVKLSVTVHCKEILLLWQENRLQHNLKILGDFGINTFLELRFLNEIMQDINTFSELFKLSKCDVGVLMRG